MSQFVIEPLMLFSPRLGVSAREFVESLVQTLRPADGADHADADSVSAGMEIQCQASRHCVLGLGAGWSHVLGDSVWRVAPGGSDTVGGGLRYQTAAQEGSTLPRRFRATRSGNASSQRCGGHCRCYRCDPETTDSSVSLRSEIERQVAIPVPLLRLNPYPLG